MEINNKFLMMTFKEESGEAAIQKSYKHNVLASVFVLGGNYKKGEEHYLKASTIVEQLGFCYSNLYTNLGNFYSQTKNFEKAFEFYRKAIENSPFASEKCDSNLKLENTLFLKIKKLSESIGNLEDSFNSRVAFVDAHTNMGFALLGLEKPEEAFCYLQKALELSPDGKEIQVNIGNAMRQIGKRKEAVEFVWKQVRKEYLTVNQMDFTPQILSAKKQDPFNLPVEKVNFVCVKWGKRYGADYVNKLFAGIRRNYTQMFEFYCLTENEEALNPKIRVLKLETKFETWWTKGHLFEGFLELEDTLNVYIDLDVVIVGNIDFLSTFDGQFALLRTDEIACETQNKNGYNSSMILFRGNRYRDILRELLEIYGILTKRVFRFDYWLEMIVPDCQFIQDLFPNQVSDFVTKCKDELDNESKIVIFPRKPKPEDYPANWVREYWVE